MIRLLWLVALCAAALPAQERPRWPDGLLRVYEEFARQASTTLDRPSSRKGSTAADDPAFPFLLVAFNSLREEEYNKAIENFLKAEAVAPQRTDIRKNLAYTYFKVGLNEKARLEFQRVTELDSKDYQAALELAFLNYEVDNPGVRAEARRIFDRVRKEGDPVSRATAETAFQNIDAALVRQIAFYREAVRLDPGNLVAHFRLARNLEERDETEAALAEYKAAESVAAPSILNDQARVLIRLNRIAEAKEALRRAAQSQDPFAAEAARDTLATLP
jgi:tetratricopeptide (TPR) repeat protein